MISQQIKKLHLAADVVEHFSLDNHIDVHDALELLKAVAIIRGMASQYTIASFKKAA